MASKVISLIVVAASIACIFAEPPVMLDERHLRAPEGQDQDGSNGWQESVPGLPGRDYPNLTSIPKTSFSCAGKTPGGYYADVETRCQVFHVCSTQGAKSSFLCPSGSIFNQRHFVCDWWYDFVCEQAVELYSLNQALEGSPDRETSSEPQVDDNYPPITPLQYNSLSAPNSDLSLASSGYPNNIRDEANIIYEDYSSGKIAETGAKQSEEKSSSTASSNVQHGSTESSASGSTDVESTRSSSDNYSDARRSQSTYDRVGAGHLNGLEPNQPHRSAYHQRQNDGRGGNYREEGRATTYRRRPSQGPDNVPRGFSKERTDESKRDDQGPGFFINNGLSEELEVNFNNPLPRENNNYVDNKYKDFSNNDSIANNDYNNNNKSETYYYNPEKNPLPQENGNYVNNNYNKNNDNSYDQNNNYYYNNNNNFNNNDQHHYNHNNNNEIKYYENSATTEFGVNNFNFSEEDNYDYKIEGSTASSRSIYSNPNEDDVDRERQREVDSADLKRKRPQQQQYPHQYNDYTSPMFLIREESTNTGNTWRDDLSTSSSGSQSPPYSSEGTYQEPATSSLSKPEQVTTPVAVVKEQVSKQPSKQSKFLGRRPTGGLPSGAGNGFPGANKILIGSDAVSGKSSENFDSNKISAAGGDRDGSVSSGWDNQENTYSSSTGYYDDSNNSNKFRDNQDWNDGGQSWNDDASYDRRY